MTNTRRGRLLCLLLALCLMLLPGCARGESEAETLSVTFFDAGKADAILVRTGEHALLIDTGLNKNGAALVDAGVSTVALNSAMVGRIHMFGVLIIPFIMVFMAFGRKGFKNIVPYLLFAGVSTGAVMFVLSNFVGAEVTSMGTGLISMLLSVLYVKVVKIKTPDEYRHHFAKEERHFHAFRALSPYIYMLIMLPVIRSYGINPISFGVGSTLLFSQGLLTPPVGAALYVGSAVSGLSVGRTTKALLPFYLLLVITLLALTFIPQITMFLPGMMGLA